MHILDRSSCQSCVEPLDRGLLELTVLLILGAFTKFADCFADFSRFSNFRRHANHVVFSVDKHVVRTLPVFQSP